VKRKRLPATASFPSATIRATPARAVDLPLPSIPSKVIRVPLIIRISGQELLIFKGWEGRRGS
jgi:hypothetical protein